MSSFLSIRIILLAAAIAAAQEANVAADSTTLEDLEQKIGILERKLEIAEEAEQAKKETGSTAQGNRDGFLLKSNDGDFQIRWRGYVHADARYFPDDPDARWANTFLLRRIRPIWEATAWKYYGVRILTDFANSSLVVLDAHVDLNFSPAANFRLGKFKAPIGLERGQSATDNHLVETSYATALVPNRDLGAQLHGSFGEETVSYAMAVLNGVPDGGNREVDSTDHKDYYARIFAHPFRQGSSEWARNLGVGFAASWGVQKGDSAVSALSAIRSPAQLSIFSYRVRTAARAAVAATPTTPPTPAVAAESRDQGTVHAFGNSLRLNPQAYWYAGGFGLFGEYVSHAQEVRRGRSGAVTELTQQAWQVTANYFLTGEAAGFRSPKPRHPLAPANADAARAAGGAAPGTPGNLGWGALELVARVSQFKADEASFGTFADPRASVSEALSYGAGVNWHLSRSVKWANAYEYTVFKDGAALSVNDGDRLPEHVLFTRLQFAL